MAAVDAKIEYLVGLLKGLGSFTEALVANGGSGFSKNFAAFKEVGVGNSCTVAKKPENSAKNRYKNILAYDHSRVKLDGFVGDNDYINANWVDGFRVNQKYVATQGPVPTTIVNFWHMVWQANAAIIVKVTREVEGETLKCHRYWPDPDSEPPQKVVLMGQIEVEHLSTVNHDFWICREFKLRKGGDERTVTQFSYEAWPDHGVPLTTREFLQFRSEVKKIEKGCPLSPIITHCSAGVGRTGTYIVIDRVLNAVEETIKSPDLDLDACITDLRKQRTHMVQTEAQYKFCYSAVLDGIRSQLSTYTSTTLSRPTKEYIEKDKAAAESKYEEEDNEIQQIIKKRALRVKATSFEDIERANKSWDKAEVYNIEYDLSDLESRFVSLAMVGAEIDLTPAMPEQVRKIVMDGKALDERKRKEKQERLILNSQKVHAATVAAKEKEKQEQKQEVKSAAAKKASKFMKKMGR